jgi:polysaccharide biosynthesis protein PslH
MHILQVCNKFPYPTRDGGALAMFNMVRGFFKAGHEVTLLSMSTPKHPVKLRNLPEAVRQMASYYAVDVDTTPRWFDVMANFLFSKASYHVQRFTSPPFENQLIRLLKDNKFDVVQLESLYLAPYIEAIKAHSKALVALRTHNLEHEIWARQAANEKNPLKQVLWEETAARIKAYEESVMQANAFDLIVPITGRDAGLLKKMGVKRPLHVTGVGIDLDELHQEEVETERPSLFYLGSLDWMPNCEGLDWFIKEVWPRIRKVHPKVPMYIAGRNMPDKYRSLRAKNLIGLGEVESAGAFIKSKDIMVVPILSGSGMRVKIVEAMAYHKPMVATPIAAEGISVKSGQEMILAEDPIAFADAVNLLLEQPHTCQVIAKNAGEFIRQRFDNDHLSQQLLAFYQQQLDSKQKAEKKADGKPEG